MLEQKLAALHSHRRKCGPMPLWCIFVLAFLVGIGLEVLRSSRNWSWPEYVGIVLWFASFSILSGVLMMRGRLRPTSSLVTRLRDAPLELQGLTLQWVRHSDELCGQLTFQFQQGKRWYVTLPADAARAAFETLSSACPWVQPALDTLH